MNYDVGTWRATFFFRATFLGLIDNAKIQPQKRLVKYFGIFISVKTLS